MLKTIILLTSRFPYAPGEEFIESEIAYLTNAADSVLILPAKLTPVQRSLPRNVEVITSLAEEAARDGKLGKFFTAALLSFRNPRAIRCNVNYLKALLILEYYSNLTQRFVRKILCERHLSSDSTLCYTYWFAGGTVGLIRLKEADSALRVITRAHGMDLYESRLALPEFPFRREIIGKLDAIFCISSNGKKHLEDSFGTSNICLSRLGTPRPHIFPVREARCPVRVVSCSLANRVKRLDRIVEVLGILAASYPSVQFEWTHIGGGDHLSDIVGSARDRFSNAPNLRHQFLGQMSNTQVIEFYENNFVDCFLNLSESEGLPVSMMEAMSFGIPVVAPNVGGVAEIVTPSSGVLLGSRPTLHDAAEAIALITVKTEGDRYRVGARALWEERFDADRNYRTFCSQLQALFAVKL